MTRTSMRIETMKFTDLEGVMLLANAHFSPPWHGQGQTIARLIHRYPGLQLVARQGRRLVGYIGCTDSEAESGRRAVVKGFVVLPSERGKGIGRRLMAQLCARLCRKGYAELLAHTTGDMAGFYEKVGFRVTGRTEMLASPARLGIAKDASIRPMQLSDVPRILGAFPVDKREAFIACAFRALGEGGEFGLCLQSRRRLDGVVVAERNASNRFVAEVKFCWTRHDRLLTRLLDQLVREATLKSVRHVAMSAGGLSQCEVAQLKKAGWRDDVSGVTRVDVYLAKGLR